MSKIPWSCIISIRFQQNLRNQFRYPHNHIFPYCDERTWKIRLLKVRVYRIKCVQICLLIPLNMCALLLCTKFFMLLKFCLWTVECSITGLSPLMHFRYAVKNADADDSTHLKTAAFKGHVGVVRELLKHGPKVESADEDGCTYIHTAASNGHVEVDRELLKLLLIIIILFLILLLFRLKPVFPDFMARGLCWEFSSVSTVCLDCALPVNEYL